MLPNKYPYVDVFTVQGEKMWRGSPFPMDIWDRLKNKPLIVDIGQLNMLHSVKFLNNRTIDELPLNSRIKIARELLSRESSINNNEIMMSDAEKINKHYIDSKEILNTFLDSPSFNSLALVYACAEDADWEKQKKTPQAIGEIWYVKEFPLNKEAYEEISTSFTCFGSVLRQIILIGPPIPSEIIIEDIFLRSTEYSN